MDSIEQNGTSHQNLFYSLLLESCSYYSKITSLYVELESKISSSPQQIAEILAQLDTTQEYVRNIDDRLTLLLTTGGSLTTENENLLQRRKELLQNNLTRNKAIAKKASTIKSHLQHEVTSLHTNRHAISGYKTPEEKTRNLIKRSF